MAYAWIACSMLDGTKITELPDLDIPTIGVKLCDSWSGQASLTLDDETPPEWRRATAGKSAYLVLLDDGQPIWGGIVTSRPITASDTVSFNVATMESYFSSRYVTDLTYTDDEQCGIVADLVTQCVLTAREAAPTPPAMIVEATAGTTTRHREYLASESKTVMTALQELAGVDGGPEWTITWRHLSAPERYVPVLVVADRIGTAKPDCMPSAAAVFEMPGSVVDFTLSEDWTDGRAANAVTATSTDADSNPMSATRVYADPIRPTLEYRFAPATSVADIDTLREHATKALAMMQDGAVALALTAVVDSAPRLGVDWSIGDDIGWSLACRSVSPGRMVGGDPQSAWIPVSGIDRCIGWEASLSGVLTVTPILASKEVS